MTQSSWSLPGRAAGRLGGTASCASAAARSPRSWRASSPSTSRSPRLLSRHGHDRVAVVVLWMYRDAFVSTRTVPAGAGHAGPDALPATTVPAATPATHGDRRRRAGRRRRRRPDRAPGQRHAVPLARARGGRSTSFTSSSATSSWARTPPSSDRAEARQHERLRRRAAQSPSTPVAEQLLEDFGAHADVAQQSYGARPLAPGAHHQSRRPEQLTIAAGVTARIASHAPAHVIVVTPRAGALGRRSPAWRGQRTPPRSGTARAEPLIMEVRRCSATSSSPSTARRTPTGRSPRRSTWPGVQRAPDDHHRRGQPANPRRSHWPRGPPRWARPLGRPERILRPRRTASPTTSGHDDPHRAADPPGDPQADRGGPARRRRHGLARAGRSVRPSSAASATTSSTTARSRC